MGTFPSHFNSWENLCEHIIYAGDFPQNQKEDFPLSFGFSPTSQEEHMINQVNFVTKENVTINREYKSTVFSMLFADKTNLLSLYNALNKSYYDNPDALQIVTLENAIYMSMKNDNAFVFEKRLHLYEHQSTPNPNLPLRDLFYVAKEYEKLISKHSLYSTKAVKIPAPHFVVFYNGESKQPESQLLKLSDLYKPKENEPMLELKVRFLNINKGCNEILKQNCKVLKEYMIFVEKIRENIYRFKLNAADAVEKSVIECIQEGILRDFLIANRKEVVSMSIFEYDEEKELKLLREAEYQAGVEDGIEVSRLESLKIMKSMMTDFEDIYLKINDNKLFKNLSKEELKSIFDRI